MQAIVVNEFGSAEQLSLANLPDRRPGDGEVVIDVEAAGVGLVDVLQRQGLLGVSAPGYIPGLEVAGRVASVGAGADERLVGKLVFAQGQGGYAQQFVASSSRLVVLPEGVSAEAAVALGTNALVAHFSIRQARLRPGESILVRGASGGIGAMAAQMAAEAGAVVTAVTNADASEGVAALGVRHVLRRGTDPEPEGPFDVIVDPVAGEAVPSLIRTLAPNGRYVINGAAAGFPPADIGGALLQGFSRSPTYSFLSLDSVPQDDVLSAATEIFAKSAGGEIRPLVAEVLPLHEAVRAHKILESGRKFGKVVLRPS
ncbi:quinone oxidoreductase family protein [Amorphus orientalis]|uniref:NADPH2:quinone reductase n=1 Tax=Amorphus orientalis TaxID=649198 RepID=A0AAE4AQJ5_9HYPH|nr:zinc-binding dehydrogenase [Amorphus orientalis]MDQ0314156.1 NADPH2:quinone reductase [Amorphus orientalis]